MGVKIKEVTTRWLKQEDGTYKKVPLPRPYYAVLVDHKGTRKFKKMRSKEAAEAKAQEIINALEKGEYIEKKEPSPITFEKYAEKWYAGYVLGNLKYATQRSYRDQLDRYILPAFGKRKLVAITRGDMIDFWREKQSGGLAPGSVRGLNTIVSAIFSDAIEYGLITVNPASKPGKHIKKSDVSKNKEFHTVEEGKVILQMAKRYTPRFYPLFLTAWSIGAREGELIGLEWGDIDWRGKFIMIRRTDYYRHVGTTKTGKSRKVDMADGLASFLEAHRKAMAAEALRRGKPMPERVFTTEDGTPQHPNNVRRAYYRCLTKAGVRRLTFHASTRKGCASGHLNSGESLSYIGEQLGHEDIKQTASTYAFLIEGKNREAANRLFTELVSEGTRKQDANTDSTSVTA